MTRNFILLITVVIASAFVEGADEPTTRPGGEISMHDMMQQCMAHCRATASGIDKALAKIDEAKAGNNVSVMKNTLDDARRQLVEMKMHMTGCMDMMDRMQDTRPKLQNGAIGQSAVDNLVRAYLDVQQLLVDDKIQGVAKQFQIIHDSAESLKESKKTSVTARANELVKFASSSPKNIEEAREAFINISRSVLALVEVEPPSREIAPVLYEAYCPMVKTSWLQTSKKIANPFMGQSMPECGSIKRTIKSASVGK